MSILEEIKENLAKEKGFGEYSELLLQNTHSFGDLDDVVNEVCKRYAIECIKASLEKTAVNAEAGNEDGMLYVKYDSIIDTDNIVLL